MKVRATVYVCRLSAEIFKPEYKSLTDKQLNIQQKLRCRLLLLVQLHADIILWEDCWISAYSRIFFRKYKIFSYRNLFNFMQDSAPCHTIKSLGKRFWIKKNIIELPCSSQVTRMTWNLIEDPRVLGKMKNS